MAKQLTDDELNLKHKARRRLIGAIALTLAVVVILPMVLDSEPKPAGQDIELRIPAPDKVGEFVPGAAVSEVVGVSPFAVSAVEAAPTPPVVPIAVAPSIAQAKPDAAPAPSVAAPGKQPVAASNSRVEVQGKIQSAADKQADKQPESKSTDKPNGGEGFVVQVGAYTNANTAKRELDKLKKWGFKAYTEKIGDKTRVRVGPYAERDKAEKARQLLEKHGLHPIVTSAKGS